jgi:uncharacterized protein YecT (DUF1311 family)
MTKRTATDQIIAWKRRRGRSKIGAELLGRVDDLARAWNTHERQAEDFTDFVPMRLSTIMEVYVRETVRQAIDSDLKYADRTEPLAKNFKLDFALLKSLHGKHVTFGDIIAHSIPISSLDHVISTYETLFPGFKKKLPESRECWTEDQDAQSLPPILSDTERALSVIGRIFEVRHIVTHEMPRERPYALEEIGEFLTSTRDFLSATDWILIGETKGDVPRTQMAMNMAAGENLDIVTREMEEVLAQVRARGEIDEKRLAASQATWETYADSEATLHASLVEGGSMYPLIWATSKAEVTRERVNRLRWWLEREEGDM